MVVTPSLWAWLYPEPNLGGDRDGPFKENTGNVGSFMDNNAGASSPRTPERRRAGSPPKPRTSSSEQFWSNSALL
jgi:hypothetical protein